MLVIYNTLHNFLTGSTFIIFFSIHQINYVILTLNFDRCLLELMLVLIWGHTCTFMWYFKCDLSLVSYSQLAWTINSQIPQPIWFVWRCLMCFLSSNLFTNVSVHLSQISFDLGICVNVHVLFHKPLHEECLSTKLTFCIFGID